MAQSKAKAAKPVPRSATKVTPTKAAEKRVYFKQADFPQSNLQEAQRIASALMDNFAGVSGSPPDVALSLGISPTSSGWSALTGASIAYGLSDGGINANVIKLTSLGRRLVAPEAEGEDIDARREAIMKPRILREFFEKYRRAKFPNDAVAINVLKSLGLPGDRAKVSIEIIKANGSYAGIIRETPTGPFINLDSPGVPRPAATSELINSSGTQHLEYVLADTASDLSPAAPTAPQATALPVVPAFDAIKANRVFITHGKQRAVVAQIKELLTFGSFEPVVSVERESTAIPVPEKVFEDMRSCGAGVLHVGAEGKYLDKEGIEHTKLNDNVLIEIGAAIALYGKRMILLVEKGVLLPSNLQGLYRCEFEGDKLDYESTMKLLKTFSQFR